MKYWKFILSSLLLILPAQFGNGCGMVPIVGNQTWVFNPNLMQSQIFSAFWYNPNDFYEIQFKADTAFESPNDIWENQVTDDWKKYSQNAFNTKELKEILFNQTGIQNKLYTWLSAKNGGQLYFQFMRKVPEVLSKLDDWSEVAWSYQTDINQYGQSFERNKVNKLIVLSETILKKNPDEFIKRRTGFQLLKIYYYTQQLEKAKQIFNTYFENSVKDPLYYSAKFYFALAHDGIEEAKLLLDVFRNSRDKKNRIASIFPVELKGTLLEAGLSTTQKNDLLCIDLMRSIKFETFTNLATIIETEPEHPLINLLLSREINKLEDKALDHTKIFNYEGYDTYRIPYYKNTSVINAYQSKMKQQAQGLLKLLNVLTNNKLVKVSNAHLILKAYTHVLSGEHENAKRMINYLYAQKLTEKELLQLQITEIVLGTFDNKLNTPDFEQKFTKLFSKLNRPNRTDFHANVASVLIGHLSWIYYLRSEFEYGALLSVANQNNLEYEICFAPEAFSFDKMMLILDNKNSHTDLFIKNLLVTKYANLSYTNLGVAEAKKVIMRSKIQWLLRRNRATEALEAYNNYKSVFKQVIELHNPFFVNYMGGYAGNDYYDKYNLAGNYMKLDKALSKVIEFQYKLSLNETVEKDKLALLLGNFFHSISSNGINNYVSYSDEESGFNAKNHPKDMQDYYTSAIAEHYYQKAWDLSSSAELGAIATIQQGACKYLHDAAFKDSGMHKLDSYKTNWNPYSGRFITKYGSNRILNNFLSNCDNIKDYYKGLNILVY